MTAKRTTKSVRTTRRSQPRSTAAAKPAPRARRKAKRSRVRAERVVLLSGGNPQIAKAEGDAPVRAYLAALPGWKRALGKRLDALIGRAVPGVSRAVKWNSPFYGIAGQGWFLGIHAYTRYLKLAFFRGSLLRPPPPGSSKHEETRYLDIHEDDELDEAQLTSWLQQAAALPGWAPGRS